METKQDEIKRLKLYLGVHPESELKDTLEARIGFLESHPNSAEFVREIDQKDPESGLPVAMSVFRHNESGAMFAVDSSYLEQCFDDDTDPVIPDPFNEGMSITLYGL